MLGRAWAAVLERERLTHTCVSRPQLDLTQPQTIRDCVTERYDVVVNCAAYTNVDASESNRDLAEAINGTGVGTLAQRCRQTGALLVHYSTDYVFNGRGASPYPTDATRDPVNAYGRSKAVGEAAIESSGAAFLLIRTSWVYAPWGKNFVRTIARLAGERPALKVVADQRGRPTSAQHLADVSLQLIDAGARGIYHVSDGGECTWHQFAQRIAQLTNARCAVNPCTTAEYPTPARRPAYSVLDLAKTEALVGPMAHWHTNLVSVIEQITQTKEPQMHTDARG